jgi:hypothetical protein
MLRRPQPNRSLKAYALGMAQAVRKAFAEEKTACYEE